MAEINDYTRSSPFCCILFTFILRHLNCRNKPLKTTGKYFSQSVFFHHFGLHFLLFCLFLSTEPATGTFSRSVFYFTGKQFPVKQKSTLTNLVNVLLCLVIFCPLHYPEHCYTKRRQWIGNGIFSSIAFRLHCLIACRSALICFCTAETGFVAV